jgi:universal stress protein A
MAPRVRGKNRALPANACIAANPAPCYDKPVKTILAPVDFSVATEGVVAEGTRLAKATGARVVLLSVIQPPVVTGEYAPLLNNVAEITAAGENAVGMNLSRLQDDLRKEGIPNETIQLNGAPVPNIIEQAKKLSADYIVMGSHGHSAFYDLLVGSTTHGVLLRASCPVIILPASKNRPGKN